jgi:hypothetical protein
MIGMGWQEKFVRDPLAPLLNSADAAIQYFSRRDLMEERVEPIQTVWQLSEPQKILKKQREDGSWKSDRKNQDIYPLHHKYSRQ